MRRRSRLSIGWFEAVEGPRTERNRMPLAVWVPLEQAEARVA